MTIVDSTIFKLTSIISLDELKVLIQWLAGAQAVQHSIRRICYQIPQDELPSNLSIHPAESELEHFIQEQSFELCCLLRYRQNIFYTSDRFVARFVRETLERQWDALVFLVNDYKTRPECKEKCSMSKIKL